MDTLVAEKAIVRTRIALLQQAMAKHGIAACLVPSSDPHLSEYLPERWQARQWLSGFTGSMATLIVTAKFAGLWADSRYWVQAEAALAGTGIALVKIPTGSSAMHIDWLADNVAAGDTVAVDGAVIGLGAARQLLQALTARGVKLRTDLDVIDEIWPERAELPTQPIYEHLAPHAVVMRQDKLAQVRAAMQRAGVQWHFISTLDDICWLFNLRGSDVSYNPIFVAHALVGLSDATLFLQSGKAPLALEAKLGAENINLAEYTEAQQALAALPAGSKLLIDPRRITLGLREAVPAGVTLVEAINPSTFAKSRKVPAEAAQVRAAMEQDAAAMAEFYAWLEGAWGIQRITELTIDEQLTAARARRSGFVCPSFGTIAGFNANGAMPHYRATPASHSVIEGNGLLLIDSGGQYLGGTTDITRVWPIGDIAAITAEQKRDYTLVLKGTMALSRTQFPRGTPSPMLDSIARAPLWAAGMEFGHGTGHGVGYFMNVHEGPQTISKSLAEPHTAMEPGMITSIEPGLYRSGKWGIRIENLVLNVPGQITEFGEFLKFETLTLCPIDTHLLDMSLLATDEVKWLNDYHAEVARRVLPLVSGAARAWLEQRTQAI